MYVVSDIAHNQLCCLPYLMRHVQCSVHFVQCFFPPFNVATTRNMHHREPDRAVENILRKLQHEDHGKCSVPLRLPPGEGNAFLSIEYTTTLKRRYHYNCINYKSAIVFSYDN